MILFSLRRDEPFRLLTAKETQGRPSFEHYATVVPVRIGSRQVETCFVTRWDVNVRRALAVNTANTPQARPGEPGYRRFRNLKLTLSAADPVRIRRYRYGPGLDGRDDFALACSDVVIRVHDTGRGGVEFAVTAPADQVVDLTQFDDAQGLQIREMIVRLNHGDAWDRVGDI